MIHFVFIEQAGTVNFHQIKELTAEGDSVIVEVALKVYQKENQRYVDNLTHTSDNGYH
jgi:hypothetical protein